MGLALVIFECGDFNSMSLLGLWSWGSESYFGYFLIMGNVALVIGVLLTINSRGLAMILLANTLYFWASVFANFNFFSSKFDKYAS